MLLEWFFIAAVLTSCSSLDKRRRPTQQPLPIVNVNSNRPPVLAGQPPFNVGGPNQLPKPPPEPTTSSVTSLEPNRKPSRLPPSRPSRPSLASIQKPNQMTPSRNPSQEPAVRPPLRPQRPPRPPSPTTRPPKTSSRLVYNVNRLNPDGSYFFDFLDSNSVFRQEQGFYKSVLNPVLKTTDRVLVKTGAYGFKVPDGSRYRVDYVADENGYRAFQGQNSLN